ncbi:MAG: hypothetical protein J6V01_05130, partial [Clostridia bacterium]|nr:hypothetical protein [Clostridia bacterium]
RSLSAGSSFKSTPTSSPRIPGLRQYRESNDKKYFRTFLGDANAWRDWLIPCLRQIYLPKPKQG